MAETAAHLVDPVFPQVPVRQWVLSLPKRLRYFLHHEPALTGPVLRIFLHAVEERLKASSPGAPVDARFGAVTFVHRFGSALNANLHFDEIPPCISPFGSLPRSKSAPGRFVIARSSMGYSAPRRRVHFHEATVLSHEDLAAVQRKSRPPDLIDYAMRAIRRRGAARCLERVARYG